MVKKHIIRQLLNKAISMALWTKVKTCDKAGFKSRFCQVHQAGKIGVYQRNPRLINDLRLYICRETITHVMNALQIHLFMQNEPKFQKVKLNVNDCITVDYDQMDTWSIRKNEPKTNPIEAKTNPIEAKTNPILANKTPIRTQFKPKQTQFQSQKMPNLTIDPRPDIDQSNLRLLINLFFPLYSGIQMCIFTSFQLYKKQRKQQIRSRK